MIHGSLILFIVDLLQLYYKLFFFFFLNVERGKKGASYGGQGVFFKVRTDSENHGP